LIAFLQLGAASSVALTMPKTQVLSHKGPKTIGEVAVKDLLGGVVELMAVEMLGA
jgi:hypothetical protein